jgi:glycosyltransferase involved in cell wall biosynthesis
MNVCSGRHTIFLSIVMPVYNEETTIEKVIAEHREVASRFPPYVGDWEIVCLDDGSMDSTPKLLRELALRTDKLKIVTHTENKGISASLGDLYEATRGSHIYVTGSDGQWPAENILPMLAQSEAGADYVVGVRSNRREVYNFQRRVVSSLYNLLPKLVFGVDTADAGSVKLGRREIFQLPIMSRSVFAEAERIVKAQRLGYRIAPVLIRFSPRSGGKASGATLSNIASSLRDCMKLRCGGLSRSLKTLAQP